jgi:hypothetical protein
MHVKICMLSDMSQICVRYVSDMHVMICMLSGMCQYLSDMWPICVRYGDDVHAEAMHGAFFGCVFFE